jgi:hypothetical protein
VLPVVVDKNHSKEDYVCESGSKKEAIEEDLQLALSKEWLYPPH